MMVFHREQRFSIRKFSVGAASVLIGITMAGQVVSAEELPTTQSNVVAPADSTEQMKWQPLVPHKIILQLWKRPEKIL